MYSAEVVDLLLKWSFILAVTVDLSISQPPYKVRKYSFLLYILALKYSIIFCISDSNPNSICLYVCVPMCLSVCLFVCVCPHFFSRFTMG